MTSILHPLPHRRDVTMAGLLYFGSEPPASRLFGRPKQLNAASPAWP